MKPVPTMATVGTFWTYCRDLLKGTEMINSRVWVAPCHYGHAIGCALADGRPVAVEAECATIATDEAFGGIEPVEDVPLLDAMAVTADDELLVMVVHRSSTTGPVKLALDVGSFTSSATAEWTELSAETFTIENTYENPKRVTPETSTVSITYDSATLTIPPFSLTRLSIPRN
jgi:alpha-N-arabinofuranosidase